MKRPLTAVLRTVAALMAAAVMMLCGTACNERELCYDHTHASPVDVEFDWTEAPDAAPVTMVHGSMVLPHRRLAGPPI